MDLAAWVGAGRWRAVLDLVEMLPRHCRTREAQLNDLDVAAAIVDAQEGQEPEKWAPTVSESTLVTDLLTMAVTELRHLRAEQHARAARKQPKKITPIPPPRTALEKARAAADERRAADILSGFGFH